MSVYRLSVNNWNQYTKSDQTGQFEFGLSCKVGEMSLTPSWFSPLESSVLFAACLYVLKLYY